MNSKGIVITIVENGHGSIVEDPDKGIYISHSSNTPEKVMNLIVLFPARVNCRAD